MVDYEEDLKYFKWDGFRMNLYRRTDSYRVKGCILLVTVILLGQCALSGCRDNKPNPGDADGGLQLRLETDFSRSEYLLGETVIVRMYLKNTTDKDIVICAWPSREELIFTRYDNKKPVVYRDTALFDRPVSKDKSFATIKSGAEIHFATPQFGEEFGGKYFDKIGRWELNIVHFYDFTGERFGLNAWQGKLSSNVLSINITPAGNKEIRDNHNPVRHNNCLGGRLQYP